MQSLELVSSSLRDDRKRVTLRSTVPTLNFDLIEDDENAQAWTGDETKSIRHHFQAAVQKLMAVGWMTERPGVDRSVVRNIASRWQQRAPDDTEKKMLGQILGNWSLMMKTCELLQGFQHELLGIEGFFDELGVNPVSSETGSPRATWQRGELVTPRRLDTKAQKVMDLAVKVIHQAKWSSLRICYHKVVENLEKELHDLKGRHEELQDQFQKIRLEYLQEVAALRDQVRVRGEVEHAIDAKTEDIVYYFEPTKALTAAESEFVFNTVKEKVLMILESNPRVATTVDLGQVEKLKEMCETKMVTDLKKTLVDKANELKEVKRVLAMMQNPNSKNKMDAKSLEVKDSMIVDLEEKVSDLRCDTMRLQEEVKVEKARSKAAFVSQEHLREECQEVHDALKDSEGERMSLLAKTESLHTYVEEMRHSEEQLMSREQQLTEQVKAAQKTNEGLARIVQRLRWAYRGQDAALLTEEERNELKLLEAVLSPSAPPSPTQSAFPRPILPKGVGGAHVHLQPIGAIGPTPPMQEEKNGGSAEIRLGASREELLGLLDDAHDQLQESWKTSDGHLSRIDELHEENLRLREALQRQSEGLLIMDSQPFDITYYADLLSSKIQDDHAGGDAAGATASAAWGDSSSPPEEGLPVSFQDLQAKLREASSRAAASAQDLKKLTEGEVTDEEKAGEIRQYRMDCLREQVDLEFQCLGAQLREAMADWQASGEEQGQICSCGSSKAAAHFKALSLRLLDMLKQLGQKTQSTSSENLQLRQDLLAMSNRLKDATQNLKTSKLLSDDKNLQQALTSLSHVSETHMPAVFDRLYRNAGSKTSSRIRELRNQNRAELMKSAVLHLVKGAVRMKSSATTVMDSQPKPEMALPLRELQEKFADSLPITVQTMLPPTPRLSRSQVVPKQESKLPSITTIGDVPSRSDTEERSPKTTNVQDMVSSARSPRDNFASGETPQSIHMQVPGPTHTLTVITHSLQVNEESAPTRSPSKRSPHNTLRVIEDTSQPGSPMSPGSRTASKRRISKNSGRLQPLDGAGRNAFTQDMELQVQTPLSARYAERRHTETSLPVPPTPHKKRPSHTAMHVLESSVPSALASHALVAQGRMLH